MSALQDDYLGISAELRIRTLVDLVKYNQHETAAVNSVEDC